MGTMSFAGCYRECERLGWAGLASWWSAVRVEGRVSDSWVSPRPVPATGIPLRYASGTMSLTGCYRGLLGFAPLQDGLRKLIYKAK
jgi:hypothetical protein